MMCCRPFLQVGLKRINARAEKVSVRIHCEQSLEDPFEFYLAEIDIMSMRVLRCEARGEGGPTQARRSWLRLTCLHCFSPSYVTGSSNRSGSPLHDCRQICAYFSGFSPKTGYPICDVSAKKTYPLRCGRAAERPCWPVQT